MDLNFELNENCDELKIVLAKNILDSEVQEVMKKLSNEKPKDLVAFKDKNIFPLEFKSIYRIFSSNNKTHAKTKDDEFDIKHRLYELEEILCPDTFVRISNSEFINMSKVSNFDLNIAGTIKVCLQNGDITFVSRRYIPKVKQFLGV